MKRKFLVASTSAHSFSILHQFNILKNFKFFLLPEGLPSVMNPGTKLLNFGDATNFVAED